MDPLLSTAMAQDNLFTQVGTALAKKGLDDQKIEGQNVLQLIASAAPTFAPAHLGQNINTFA
jgi:hypothetical protein